MNAPWKDLHVSDLESLITEARAQCVILKMIVSEVLTEAPHKDGEMIEPPNADEVTAVIFASNNTMDAVEKLSSRFYGRTGDQS